MMRVLDLDLWNQEKKFWWKMKALTAHNNKKPYKNWLIIYNYLSEETNLKFSCIRCKRILLHLRQLTDFAFLFRFLGSLGTAASLSDKLLNSRNFASTSFCLVSHSSLRLVRNFSKSKIINVCKFVSMLFPLKINTCRNLLKYFYEQVEPLQESNIIKSVNWLSDM